MSPNSDIHSLRFLFSDRELDDEQQDEREVEYCEQKLDVEKNDLNYGKENGE